MAWFRQLPPTGVGAMLVQENKLTKEPLERWLMRNVLVGCLSALLLASTVLGQDHGTAMLRLRQPNSPASFGRTVHGIEDLLMSATLKNVSNTSLVGYRIGWVVVYPGGKDKVGLGLPVDVQRGLEPGQTTEVPAQGVDPRVAAEEATAVVFFIAEVRTASGGLWKPRLSRIEQDARQMAHATLAPSN
jgi:hypothetical protein